MSSAELKLATVPACARAFAGADRVPFYTLDQIQDPASAISRAEVWATRCSEYFADPAAAYANERAFIRNNALKAEEVLFVRIAGKFPLLLWKKLKGNVVPGNWRNRCRTAANCQADDVYEDDVCIFMKVSGTPAAIQAAEAAGSLQIEREVFAAKNGTYRHVNAIVKKAYVDSLRSGGLLACPIADTLTSTNEAYQATVRLSQDSGEKTIFNLALKFQAAGYATSIRANLLRVRWARKLDANEVQAIREFDPHVSLVIPDVRVEAEESLVSKPRGDEVNPAKVVFQLRSISMRSEGAFNDVVLAIGRGGQVTRSCYVWANVTFPISEEAALLPLLGTEVQPGFVLARIADESV